MSDSKPKFIKPDLIDLDDENQTKWNNDLFEISDLVVHAPDEQGNGGGSY